MSAWCIAGTQCDLSTTKTTQSASKALLSLAQTHHQTHHLQHANPRCSHILPINRRVHKPSLQLPTEMTRDKGKCKCKSTGCHSIQKIIIPHLPDVLDPRSQQPYTGLWTLQSPPRVQGRPLSVQLRSLFPLLIGCVLPLIGLFLPLTGLFLLRAVRCTAT